MTETAVTDLPGLSTSGSKSEQAYQAVKARIVEGAYSPGYDPVPSVRVTSLRCPGQQPISLGTREVGRNSSISHVPRDWREVNRATTS